MILGLLTVVSFSCLTLVVLPAFSEQFNFSSDKTSNIGSTIGGIVGPIVGMFSAYLLYEALTAQQEGNKAQRIKNDSDIIFMLINQLDKEYDTFSTFDRISGAPTTLKGFEALQHFSGKFQKDKKNQLLLLISNEMSKLWYLLESFEIIRNQVNELNLNSGSETVFNKQLSLYYQTKFQEPVELITRETKALNISTFVRMRAIHSKNFVKSG